MPGRCFVPVVAHPGDVAVWRFGMKIVGMLKMELFWDIAPPAASVSESPCVGISGVDASNLMVLAQFGLVDSGAAIFLETSDA